MAITGMSGFDDRSAIAKFRRTELWALLRQEGIAITEQETKNELIFKALGAGIDPDNPPRLATAEELAGEPAAVNYGSLNFIELRKLCRDRGIAYEMTDKRADLLAKLGA